MKVHGKSCRTIWRHPENPEIVQAIDQRLLPHRFVIEDFRDPEDVVAAVRDMHVRGAPLIGVAAAWGLYLAALKVASGIKDETFIYTTAEKLKASRPTAVNLSWAVDRTLQKLREATTNQERVKSALSMAEEMAEEEVERCRLIGEHGLALLEKISARKKGSPVQILTHCNAGWLACIDWGTATAPVYKAADLGIPLHVWVDETRPRNQGASLTAWELLENGIPHTVIADNTGGHLMQHDMVDIVLVGADRVTRSGDAANKIGTYLKALAAKDNDVPFYVAVPGSTFDFSISDGQKEIPIETRSEDEVRYVQGLQDGELSRVLIMPEGSPAANFGFDVTPARLISGLITERGICRASEKDILRLFPGAE